TLELPHRRTEYSCLERYGFFFQAEDGIRDATVTGVQTCALPIYLLRHDAADPPRLRRRRAGRELRLGVPAPLLHAERPGRMDRRLLGRRLHLLLVAPAFAPRELALGGARRAPPERGLQPGGGAAAGGAVGVDHLALP